MVSVTVSAVSKSPAVARGLPFTVQIPDRQLGDVTVGDLKALVAAKFPKFYISRQKLALARDAKALSDDINLKDAGVTDGGEVYVKDLGPQVTWRTVYLVEYSGPILVHPLVYNFPGLFYRSTVQHSSLQQFIYAFVLLHFIKRELETVFVHRFSHATMPLRNIFKNSAHYHLLSGVALAYAIYSPTYSASSPYIQGTIRDDPRFLWAGAALWLFGELSNLHSHLALRALRPAGTRNRAIPYGYGFDLVSCPHYLWETISWLSVAILTGSWVAWFFLAVSIAQMVQWALKKHKAYKKEFGKEYPRRRKAIFPFIL